MTKDINKELNEAQEKFVNSIMDDAAEMLPAIPEDKMSGVPDSSQQRWKNENGEFIPECPWGGADEVPIKGVRSAKQVIDHVLSHEVYLDKFYRALWQYAMSDPITFFMQFEPLYRDAEKNSTVGSKPLRIEHTFVEKDD